MSSRRRTSPGSSLSMTSPSLLPHGQLVEYLTDPDTARSSRSPWSPTTVALSGPPGSPRMSTPRTASCPHPRTNPEQNAVRESAFESMKYERLYLEEINEGLHHVEIGARCGEADGVATRHPTRQ